RVARAGRRLDVVDQEGRGRGAARDGGVLLHSNGHGLVTMRLLALATGCLLALPVALAGQDVGLPLGTTGPAVTLADLDGKVVDLGQYVGKQPVLLGFWVTCCTLCTALEPSLKAATAQHVAC